MVVVVVVVQYSSSAVVFIKVYIGQVRRHDLSAGVARKIWRSQESTSGHIGLTE